MMKEEFEKLAGYEVSWKDYNEVIEPMYMAVSLSKQEFVQCIDRKRFALKTEAQLVREMRKLAKHLMETCEHYTDFDAKKQLDELAKEYVSRFWSGLEFYLRTDHTGDRFWNAPGRGCSFPSDLVVFDKKGYTYKELKLA